MFEKFCLIAAFLLLQTMGSAQAALCNVPGRQDATCLNAIVSTGPAQPTCGAGQTTVQPSTWQGASWSTPVCTNPIPPRPSAMVCSYGFASGPTWSGSSWNYSCNPPPPSCTPGSWVYSVPWFFSLACGNSNSLVEYGFYYIFDTGLKFGVSGQATITTPSTPAGYWPNRTYYSTQSCANGVCTGYSNFPGCGPSCITYNFQYNY